jgi:xanthine dehydrogenase YagS FAD-binding subunit
MVANYIAPSSPDHAATLLAAPGARPLAGGTDLLGALESGLERAAALVDLTRVAELCAIEPLADGGLRIGGAARLEVIAQHADVIARFPALAQALASVGTPALRQMGTIAGNLCQRPRCWYLRSHIRCLKNGGTGCPAAEGENQYHAILGGGPCHAAHPSDAAVALLALDAVVVVRGPGATRRISIAELYANAATDPSSEVTLTAGEFIDTIELPAASAGGAQEWVKLMQRGAWDFATVSLAGVRRTDGNVRLALGGVAPMPWLVNPSVGEDVASGELDEDSADALAARALHDAKPLAKNEYKMQQAAALLTRAMRTLSRG